LKQQIAENGGDRVERLQRQIQQQGIERERRFAKSERYRNLLVALSLKAVQDAEAFVEQQLSLQQKQTQLRQQQADHNNRSREAEFDFLRRQEEYNELKQSITQLKSRQSNIDQRQIDIRRQLCIALSDNGAQVGEADLPFAGELLQVREEDKKWQGAIERLMHNFGQSMLVPDEHYSRVAQWVDETLLRGRLVYFRVRQNQPGRLPSLHPDSLIRKITIKPDSPFYLWLEQETTRRFDIACCESQQQFRREKRAITSNGQIKASGERHEKDDRFAIDDRSRFVLGWSNQDKIAALANKATRLEREMAALGQTIGGLQKHEKQIKDTLEAISKLEEYSDFEELDWQPLARIIANLQAELGQLESSSDLLQTLTQKLKELESALTDNATRLSKAHEELGSTKQKIVTTEEQHDEVQTILAGEETEQSQTWFERLDKLLTEALGEHKLTLSSCDTHQQQMRKWLQDRIDTEDRRVSRLQEKIVKAMSDYKNDFRLETQEVDAAVEAADEYRQMLTLLQADDLPRFESRFKSLLNENTIREVANFQSQLHRERETIKDRIAQINDSLTQIDYNPGRYIKLEAQPSQDVDIRDFQTELRACTEGAITGSQDEQYSENKFLQVKRIIERFRGREGLSDQDKRWAIKVSDVRNWFGFAASERWREDDSEFEHYSDSGGKSGGQKEKLAYTILAASLAYQFGLEWGALRSRSFRFVVIDEAFGRGSDESTQYGLKLFEQLNLQLLIVTPLQKIHIIEPYVASVGFVHNEVGLASKVRNLSIEAYHQEKAQLHRRNTDDK